MKVKELIEELQKHDPEMEIEICTGSFECSPETTPVELYAYEHKNWKWNSEEHTYDPLPSNKRLLFTEKS